MFIRGTVLEAALGSIAFAVKEIAREAGRLADAYLMPTGSFTWEFSTANSVSPTRTAATAAQSASLGRCFARPASAAVSAAGISATQRTSRPAQLQGAPSHRPDVAASVAALVRGLAAHQGVAVRARLRQVGHDHG